VGYKVEILEYSGWKSGNTQSEILLSKSESGYLLEARVEGMLLLCCSICNNGVTNSMCDLRGMLISILHGLQPLPVARAENAIYLGAETAHLPFILPFHIKYAIVCFWTLFINILKILFPIYVL